MEQYHLKNESMQYRPNSAWKRHDDGGRPARDPEKFGQFRALSKRYVINPKSVAK
jgi:hypothetical protein